MELLEVPVSGALLLLDLPCNTMKKIHSQGIVVICLDLCSIVGNALFPKLLLETISGICLTLQMTEAVIIGGINRSMDKSEKEELRNELFTERVQNAFLGNLESHTHLQDYMLAQEIPEWAPVTQCGNTEAFHKL